MLEGLVTWLETWLWSVSVGLFRVNQGSTCTGAGEIYAAINRYPRPAQTTLGCCCNGQWAIFKLKLVSESTVLWGSLRYKDKDTMTRLTTIAGSLLLHICIITVGGTRQNEVSRIQNYDNSWAFVPWYVRNTVFLCIKWEIFIVVQQWLAG